MQQEALASLSPDLVNQLRRRSGRGAAEAPLPPPGVAPTKARLPPPGGVPPRAPPGGVPPLARTRFATDGLPVDWVSDAELAAGTKAADVVSRDPLRRDEGAVAEGYTVEEALVLLQCAHVPLQRAGASPLTAALDCPCLASGEVLQPLNIGKSPRVRDP